MSHARVKDIRDKIKYLESERQYTISMIALLMAEQDNIDLQIAILTQAGIGIDAKLRDLKAELADTI